MSSLVCRRRSLIQSGHQEWRFAKYHFDIDFAANNGSSPLRYFNPSWNHQCTSSALSVSLGEGNGAAGTIYYPLRFTNIGTTACALEGYPGISLVDSSGTRLGHRRTGTLDLANGCDSRPWSVNRGYGESVPRCPQHLFNS